MAQFNVLMFGSRRAGKSTILSSMIDSFEKLSACNITLTATEDTEGLLKLKKQDSEKIFDMKPEDTMKWVIEEIPSQVSDSYEFIMSAPGSDEHMLCFKDIPGEWLMNNESELREELKKSQIIIIAIDTPHLIEENGQHSDAFHITCNVNTLLAHIKSEEDVPRMILFVPIKCEKYYYAGRMQEVVDAIEKQYEDLLTTLRTGKKKNLYTVAITPILSLGGIVFCDFQRDDKGYVDVIKIQDSSNPSLYLRPKAAYYQLYEPDPSFKPKFCEQPVLYVLSFISMQVKDLETKGRRKYGIFFRYTLKIVLSLLAITFHATPLLKLIWGDIFMDRKFVQNADQSIVHLKTTGDGYIVLQDPMGIQNIN